MLLNLLVFFGGKLSRFIENILIDSGFPDIMEETSGVCVTQAFPIHTDVCPECQGQDSYVN